MYRVAPGWGLEESNAGARCEICFSGMCRVRSPVSCVSGFRSSGDGRPERVKTSAESVRAQKKRVKHSRWPVHTTLLFFFLVEARGGERSGLRSRA